MGRDVSSDQAAASALRGEGSDLSLRYRYQLHDDRTAPLVVLVHGRAGTFDLMWPFAHSCPRGCSFVAPQADLPDAVLPHAPQGLSWWLVDSQNLHADAQAAAKKLADFIDEFLERYELQPRRIIALGFSQGGALLSILLQRDPWRFDAAALLASFVIELADGRQARDGRQPTTRPPLFMAHGLRDETVPIERARSGAEYLRALGHTVTMVEDDVGHKVGTAGMRELKAWLTARLTS